MQILKTNGEQVIYPSLLKDKVLVFFGAVSEFCEHDCLPVLSEKEMARSLSYLLASDRCRSIVSRAALKQVLAGFLKTAAAGIEFCYSKHGKPFLQDDPELKFSIAHSGDAFVIGVSRGDDIGIDVEQLDREADLSKLQTYLFTTAELIHFKGIDPHLRKNVFINSWTKKEAVLKATGEGLTRAMNTLELAFSENKIYRTGKRTNAAQPGSAWFLEHFSPMDAYTAAVAVKGKHKTVEYISIKASPLTS